MATETTAAPVVPTLTPPALDLRGYVPGTWIARGATQDVFDRFRDALDREQCEDIRTTPEAVTFGAKTGALSVDKGVSSRWASTAHAVAQLVDRSSPSDCPRGSVAEAMLWAWPAEGARQWRHVVDRASLAVVTRDGTKQPLSRRTMTIRTALDCHATREAKGLLTSERHAMRYVRAVVSEQHSAASGDDAVVLSRLSQDFRQSEWGQQFFQGTATIERDPAGLSRFYIKSAFALDKTPGKATMQVSASNSEVGTASFRAWLDLVFSVKLTNEGERRDVAIAIPGATRGTRAVHRGGAVDRELSGFGEQVGVALIWAPGALAKLANETHDDKAFQLWTDDAALKTLERAGAKGDNLTIGAARMLATSIAGDIAVSLHLPPTCALVTALVCSHLGAPTAAGKLVKDIAGSIDPR